MKNNKISIAINLASMMQKKHTGDRSTEGTRSSEEQEPLKRDAAKTPKAMITT